nr:Hsp70 family protein [uncultured Desulfuromonas sp.]
MDSGYAIGIDLGTSNSALSIVSQDKNAAVQSVPLYQQVTAHGCDAYSTLPSFLYLFTPQEQLQAPGLPWQTEDTPWTIGRYAQEYGAKSPDRLVSSAKSWLCHSGIDPQQPLLPWQSSLKERLLSPFAAQVAYLRHLREALLHHLSTNGQSTDLTTSHVTLTVPASFDEIARILTADAAQEAGWGDVTLLEEQQAAFYAWLDRHQDNWRDQVQCGDLILVCDVGGGTADFSLIAVAQNNGELTLERVSVGKHLLLGGDNMDLALAYALKAQLEAAGHKLDSQQFTALVHGCRLGKEALFADPQRDDYPLSIAGRGASLLARTLTTSLSRTLLEQVVIDGFLARTTIDQAPQQQLRSGLQDFGLPYVQDPVLTRHLAAFLIDSATNVCANANLKERLFAQLHVDQERSWLRPTAVLFNGGIFKADPIRQRVFDVLQHFNGEAPLRQLQGEQLDLAVAHGAAVYARQQTLGEGIRIKAGISRSYYIGIESSMPAIPGFTPPLKGLCVIPQGMQEGSEIALEGQEFGLMTGQSVQFRFFSSTTRAGDHTGDWVEDSAELEETSSLNLTLSGSDDQRGQLIPVQLHARINALGILELWMQHCHSQQRWKIEFNVRGDS